jgi:hypothetical protein
MARVRKREEKKTDLFFLFSLRKMNSRRVDV